MKATYIPTRSPEELTADQVGLITELITLTKNSSGKPAVAKAALQGLAKLKSKDLEKVFQQLSLGISPEKLAACLARYSRSQDGIGKILFENADKSPDAIFKFVDYGHASIGGLTGGIAIAIDGVSMLLIFKLFEFAQMADGQESSTRYIDIGLSSLPKPEDIGIPNKLTGLWRDTCEIGFDLYQTTSEELSRIVKEDPNQARIPQAAQSKPKMLERMLKNYALDRARYFLPLACYNNVALVATARIWADILRLTESLQWPEAISVAAAIREELKIAAPNLVRHSYADNASIGFVQELLHVSQAHASSQSVQAHSGTCQCRMEIFNPDTKFNRINHNLADSLLTRGNRYSHAGTALKRQVVQVEWSHVAFAELRDLNRHRTGYRFTDLAPKGFYLPDETKLAIQNTNQSAYLSIFNKNYSALVSQIARQAQPGLQAYAYFLGTQVAFEHTQGGDKFLYEVELRTGLGAHFRYAEHLRQAAELYFEKCPETRKYIQLGDAEPE